MDPAIDPAIDLAIDGARLTREIERLAGFSSAPAPAVTRVLYSGPDLKARAWFKGLCQEAGLALREDALGTLFARWEGAEPGLRAVATGSHIDAIPFSGRFDGTVGVLGALEAFRALMRAGFRPRRSLELVMFTAEEPTRFGVGCLGSRAMCGALGAGAIRALEDDGGRNPEQAAREAGFSGSLEDARLERGHYHAFVELHIEQGPRLEEEGVPIGVVTHIAAPATLHVTIGGEGGHAGAVLMNERKDALLGAAEVALEVEKAAKASGHPNTVATVGILDVFPRAVNSIPSRVFLSVDARDTALERRDRAVARIQEAVREVRARRGLKAEVTVVNADPPAVCDPEVVQAIEGAAADAGLGTLQLVSRAYHDSLFMAQLAPTGMIFIPCRGGVSHRPDEYASPEDIHRGTEVLTRTLARLSSQRV